MIVNYEKNRDKIGLFDVHGSDAYLLALHWAHPVTDIGQPTATMSNRVDTFQALRFRDAFIASDI